MKLRIRDNTIRLRLARGEVDALRSDGVVRGATSFGGGRSFGYACESAPGLAAPTAQFDGQAIVIRVPEADIAAWADTDRVSIRAEQVLDAGVLSLLIEKDFACLAEREGEDDSDMFAHPLAAEDRD